MFAEDTPWHVPWLEPVSANIFAAAERLADQTIFTQFLPPRQAGDMPGRWRTYYEKWWMMTGEYLPAEMVPLDRRRPARSASPGWGQQPGDQWWRK
jgi:hypothetical protein